MTSKETCSKDTSDQFIDKTFSLPKMKIAEKATLFDIKNNATDWLPFRQQNQLNEDTIHSSHQLKFHELYSPNTLISFDDINTSALHATRIVRISGYNEDVNKSFNDYIKHIIAFQDDDDDNNDEMNTDDQQLSDNDDHKISTDNTTITTTTNEEQYKVFNHDFTTITANDRLAVPNNLIDDEHFLSPFVNIEIQDYLISKDRATSTVIEMNTNDIPQHIHEDPEISMKKYIQSNCYREDFINTNYQLDRQQTLIPIEIEINQPPQNFYNNYLQF